MAERDGFEQLSMRLLARELGVSPMALYRHVANRAICWNGLVERLLAELELPDVSLPWDQRLRGLAAGLRSLARRRPESFGLLLRRRAVGHEATRAREVALRALRDAGLDREAAQRMERLSSTVVMGFALSAGGGALRWLRRGGGVRRRHGAARATGGRVMEAGTPSRTAEYMALFRALESARPTRSRLFEDRDAARFLRPPRARSRALRGFRLLGP